MKRFLLVTLTAGLLAPTADLSAQVYNGVPGPTEYLNFISGSGVNGGYGVQVGPYTGHFQGDPASAQFSIYCVDFNHYARSQWVNVTSLAGGSLGNTRLNDYATYQKAAYLSSLFETRPTTSWGSIHAAIWELTSGVEKGNDSARDYYLALAETNAGSFSTDGWYVLSPFTADGPAFDGTGQEFIMRSVPEPGTFVLMASGLLLLAAFSRKRLAAIVREDA